MDEENEIRLEVVALVLLRGAMTTTRGGDAEDRHILGMLNRVCPK